MKYFSMLFWGFICFLPASCILEKERSIFTSVNTDQCQLIPKKKVEGSSEEEVGKEGETVVECKGVKGYQLYIVDDGTRSWYVLKHPKKGIISFEQDIVYKQNILGDFPNVGGSDEVEWILDTRGIPSGFVFRVFSQINDEETGRFKTVARYFAVKLDVAIPVMAGVAKTKKSVKELLKDSH